MHVHLCRHLIIILVIQRWYVCLLIFACQVYQGFVGGTIEIFYCRPTIKLCTSFRLLIHLCVIIKVISTLQPIVFVFLFTLGLFFILPSKTGRIMVWRLLAGCKLVLVNATPPTVLDGFGWNFAQSKKMMPRCAWIEDFPVCLFCNSYGSWHRLFYTFVLYLTWLTKHRQGVLGPR
jgi:hypothetical protein